jgi:hypothetical protein
MRLSPTRRLLDSPHDYAADCHQIKVTLGFVSAQAKCRLHISNTTTIAQMCWVHLVELVNAAHHASQAALPPGPVEQLRNLTKSNSSTTSQPLVRSLTCRVSGIDNLGTVPPKFASIRPDAFCAHPKSTDWLGLSI